jgi:hypothetical protein
MIRKSIRMLVCLALLLTPILYLPAVMEMTMRAGLTAGRDAIAMKAAKDVLLIVIFSLFLLDVLWGRAFVSNPWIWALATGIAISFCVSFYRSGPLLAMIGLRSISPFVLIFVSYRYMDARSLRAIVKVLGVLLFVEFCATVVRALYGVPVDGRTFFGLVARPSGTFASPTSWSVFITLIACYKLGFDVSQYGYPRGRTWLVVGVCALLVYLAAAGAGLFAFTGLMASYFLFLSKTHRYLKAAVLPLILLAPIVILSNLPLLTGRARAYSSVRIRSGIILDLMQSMDFREMLIGKGLGVGSDVAITVRHLNPDILAGVDDLYYSDSIYAAMLGQMGLVFAVVFLLFNVYLFTRALRRRWFGVCPIAILAIPAVMAGGAGSVITEVYPVNWLLFILYGMALRDCTLRIHEQESQGQREDLPLEPSVGMC